MVRIAVLIGVLATSWSWAAAETVYQGVGADGSVIFSDEPFPGSKRVRIDLTPPRAGKPITRSSPGRAPSRTPADQNLPGQDYTRALVLKPSDAAVFWSGNGEVPVELSVSPPLQRQFGHQINVLLDGQPYGPQRTGTGFTLTNVSRGAHTLQFQIIDADGQILTTSPAVAFQLHRPSVLNRPGINPLGNP
jgi:hypothetical protein